jgi:sugar transferase (PEP-CTERM/EpsH1 system associated)
VVLVYSSALAQYVVGRIPAGTRLVVDFVDADAEKWRAYAQTAAPPMRWLFAAESRRLVAFERRVLAAADAGVLISETERRLLGGFLGEGEAKLEVIPNGVDTDYFRPSTGAVADSAAVMCGRMDYRPNVEGAQWFAREILPKVRERRPEAVFRIVGAAPSPQVMALDALPGVEVVGAVPDVRPYLAGAAVVVAPLRTARGIQNTVLEGMAAGRPVVATSAALDGIAAEPGRDVLAADTADDLAAAVAAVLANRAPAGLGERGRAFVLRRHRWEPLLQAFERLIAGESSPQAAA